MNPPPPDQAPRAPTDRADAGGRGGQVVVERRDLRKVRSLVGGLLAVLVLLVGLLSVQLVQNQNRCEDGNVFRRVTLPLAFDKFAEFLGEEFHADPARVDDARDRFAVVMDDLFPERDCRLVG